MIKFFYQNKTLKDTVQSKVIFQQLFEQVVSVPLQLPPIQILHSLILMHDISTKNFEELVLVPKLTVGKFVSNSCCVSHPARILQKMTLQISEYELWSLHEFSHNQISQKGNLTEAFHAGYKSVVSMN